MASLELVPNNPDRVLAENQEVTLESQAGGQRIRDARAARNANPTSVTADQLSQPVSQVTVPQP